jgi:hypothetical protein
MSVDRSEGGFTLVEVLLATVISGLIIGGITTALIVSFRNYPRSASRLAQSNNPLLLSSWLVPDVQSAGWGSSTQALTDGGPDIDTSATGDTSGCLGGQSNPGGTNVVALRWSDADLGNLFVADYRVVNSQLIRFYCTNATSPLQTVVGRDIAAYPATNANLVGDSVVVHVQTTNGIAGAACGGISQQACYSFNLSASRRTPAFRIFALPTIDSTWVSTFISDPDAAAPFVPIAGTSVPKTNGMTLTITDQAKNSVTIGNISADSNGAWSVNDAGSQSISAGDHDRDDVFSTSVLKPGIVTMTLKLTDGTIVATTRTVWVTPPKITSLSATTFTVGVPSTPFTVQTSGYPLPAITETGALPPGVTLTDNHNGTATLTGTPGPGSLPTYTFTITANNGIGTQATQNFTLTIDAPPTITSAPWTLSTVGALLNFKVQTSGNPAAAITESGALPPGVILTDNHNGTATLGGIPAPGSLPTYTFTITANNGIGTQATQNFTLTVDSPPLITSAASTTGAVGAPLNFSVTTSGNPPPAITETGALPPGVTLTDNRNGTATLTGTPGPGSLPTYTFTITASNGVGPPVPQVFTLTVN